MTSFPWWVLFCPFLTLGCSQAHVVDLSDPAEPVSTTVSSDWSYGLGSGSVLANPFPGNAVFSEVYNYWPDGHISAFKNGTGDWTVFWGEYKNMRTKGATPFPQDHAVLSPQGSIFGGRSSGSDGFSAFNNGGSWIMNVFQTAPGTLTAFYHAEDHWYPRNAGGIAYKSIARATSVDQGVSWTDRGRIIQGATAKPAEPAWLGAGDFCVVWNHELSGYVCYFQEDSAPSMAFTSDSTGATGWKKWYNDKFDSSQPGSGGLRSDIPGLSGNGGANFSVHWNTYLLQWVMVWQKWSAGIYIAQSLDGVHWTNPRTLFLPGAGRMTWYPTIIGPQGDLKVGSTGFLYYTDMNTSYGDRKAMYRSITFSRTD